MSAHASHAADSADPQQALIQCYLLRQAPLESLSGKNKTALGRTQFKLLSTPSTPAAPSACQDTMEELNNASSETSDHTAQPALLDTAPMRDGSAAACLSTSGGSSGSEAKALLSAFHADLASWASKIESSLHAELEAALRQQVSTSETTFH